MSQNLFIPKLEIEICTIMKTPLLSNDYNLVETEIDLKEEDENEKG